MGIRKIGHGIVLFVLLAALPLVVHAAMDTEAERLARWQLNNADLLVDEGKYMEALEYIDSALEVSQYPKTRSDALLARAMVLSTFLDAPKQAVETYARLAREFPKYAETAAYQSAFLQLQTGNEAEAKKEFKAYLKKFPNGRFRFQAEAMLESMGIPGTVAPPPIFVEGRPIMRVLLAKKGRSVTIKSSGSLCIEGIGCGTSMTIKPSGGFLSVNGHLVKEKALSFSPGVPLSLNMDGKKKRVRGEIRITNKKDRLHILNRINIEDYLRSVVPAESYASWPIETLKAQAIAARTYAYYQKTHRKSRDYDVRADTWDQMYGGVDRETKRTDQAVRDTNGMLLTYKGKPILSQYTANSGGHSADAGAVFNAPKPYLVAHADPASLKGKMASWTRKFTTAQIVAALGKIGVNASGLRAIEPEVTGPSGRVVKVRLHHSRGSTVLRTRTTLASSRVLKLPEVLFRIERNGDTYIFRGRGHGHGVGYSQWGSAELGKTQKHESILAFYYPGSSLSKGWK